MKRENVELVVLVVAATLMILLLAWVGSLIDGGRLWSDPGSSGVAFSTYTNHSVRGVMVHAPVMVVPLTVENRAVFDRVVSHEYLHFLVRMNKTHFCGEGLR